jgi:uroporphyrinogen-III synthase
MVSGAPVWITRARPGADATAARVAALGFEAVVDPLLAVETLAFEVDLSDVRALAFTSANGVEAFARGSSERGLPVFAVGRATARAAEAAGFASVTSADGDVAALARLIARAKPGPVLWAGAEDPAADLVALLDAGGVKARAVAVYRTVARAPSDETLARLQAPLTVLLHSPRAARALAAILARRSGPASRVLCLSEAVAAPVRDLAEVAISARPDDAALLDLLKA